MRELMKNVLALCLILGAKCDHLVAVWSPALISRSQPAYGLFKINFSSRKILLSLGLGFGKDGHSGKITPAVSLRWKAPRQKHQHCLLVSRGPDSALLAHQITYQTVSWDISCSIFCGYSYECRMIKSCVCLKPLRHPSLPPFADLLCSGRLLMMLGGKRQEEQAAIAQLHPKCGTFLQGFKSTVTGPPSRSPISSYYEWFLLYCSVIGKEISDISSPT